MKFARFTVLAVCVAAAVASTAEERFRVVLVRAGAAGLNIRPGDLVAGDGEAWKEGCDVRGRLGRGNRRILCRREQDHLEVRRLPGRDTLAAAVVFPARHRDLRNRSAAAD